MKYRACVESLKDVREREFGIKSTYMSMHDYDYDIRIFKMSERSIP